MLSCWYSMYLRFFFVINIMNFSYFFFKAGHMPDLTQGWQWSSVHLIPIRTDWRPFAASGQGKEEVLQAYSNYLLKWKHFSGFTGSGFVYDLLITNIPDLWSIEGLDG